MQPLAVFIKLLIAAGFGHFVNVALVHKVIHCHHIGRGFTLNCAEHTTEKTVPVGEPLGHDWDEGTVTTKPTCEKDGVRTFTCKRDSSHTDTKAEPATGHSFTKYESDGNATCKKDGTETAKCDHGCGETDTRTDKGSKLGHKCENGKCVRCGLSVWNPETGDNSNIFLWTGLLIVSLMALLLLFFRRRKKKDES